MRLKKSISILIITLLLIAQIPIVSFANGTIGGVRITDHYDDQPCEHGTLNSVDITISRLDAVTKTFYSQVLDSTGTSLLTSETVRWSLSDNDNGNNVSIIPINSNTIELGVSPEAQSDTFYLVATSDTDSSKSAQVQINLQAPSISSIEINGENKVYISKKGESVYHYSGEVLDPDGNPIEEMVTWSITSPLNGVSIDVGGSLRVSPTASEGYVTIKATSVADSRVYQTKEIQVAFSPSELVSSVTIAGKDTILIDPLSNVSYAYVATVKNSLGETLQSEGVSWDLYDAYSGVSLNNSGVLTVSPSADEGYIVINATSLSEPSIYGNLMVRLSKPTSTENPVLTTIEINGNSSVYIDPTQDTTVQYTATAKDQFDNELQSETVSWALKDPYAGVSINADGLLSVSKTALVGTIGIIATSTSDSNVKDILYVELTNSPNNTPSDPPTEPTDPSVPSNPPSQNSNYITITGSRSISTNKYGNYLGVYEGVVKDSSGNEIEGEYAELELSTNVSGVSLYRVSPN